MSVTSHVSPPSTDALVALVPVVCSIAEEFEERTQAIGQPDAEHQRVHEERVTIRPIGGGLPRRPDVVAERQPWPELVGERHQERGVDTVA